jgi:hypothetical protein
MSWRADVELWVTQCEEAAREMLASLELSDAYFDPDYDRCASHTPTHTHTHTVNCLAVWVFGWCLCGVYRV